MASSLPYGDEAFRTCRPVVGFRLLPVVQLDEIRDRLLEFLDGVVGAAPEPAAGELPEEALDGVHPGAGGGREVEGGAVEKPLVPWFMEHDVVAGTGRATTC